MTWPEFFDAHPAFAQRRASYSLTGDFSADCTQTITVGAVTVTREITTRPRSGSDYYSQHRRAHGDFRELATDEIRLSGPESEISALRNDAGSPADDGELWQCLVALAGRQPRARRAKTA